MSLNPSARPVDMPDLDQIVREHYAHVYRFCYSLCGNSGDAQDATQQTFLILVKQSNSIREWPRIRSWLFTVARRFTIELKIKQQKFTPLPEESSPDQFIAPAISAADSSDGARAVAALQELDPPQREALALFYLQECSYEEIATQTNTPLGTVMSRLHRGKQRLRSLLGIPQLSTTP